MKMKFLGNINELKNQLNKEGFSNYNEEQKMVDIVLDS